MNFIDPIFFRIRTIVHCVTNNILIKICVTPPQKKETKRLGNVAL